MATRRRLPLNVERTPGKGFRARVKINQKIVRGHTRRTAHEAAEDARELLSSVVRRGGPETLGEAFDAVRLACKRAGRRAGTLEFYEEGWKRVKAHFGEDRRVAAIRVDDVQGFVDTMLDKGNKPATIRGRLRVLRRLFCLAGRQPIGLKQLVVPDVEDPDPGSFLSLRDVRAMLSKLCENDETPDMFWMVGFLVLTGARRSEVARMLKEDVQPDRVLIRQGKKRPRVIPLPESNGSHALVEHLHRMSDTEWLLPCEPRSFRTREPREDGGEASRVWWLVRLSRKWRGIEPKATLHRLRAATATVLSELDPPVPIPVVAHLLGHQSTTAMGITGLYARPSPAAVRAAVERLWQAIAEGYDEA